MLSDGYLLGWDAGTGGWRCLVVDIEGGMVGHSFREGRFVRADGLPTSLEFDPEQMWDAFGQVTREALQSIPSGEVLALSTTSFRDGVVFLDGDGEALYAGTNRDARAVAEGFEMAQSHGGAIYSLTGRWPVGLDAAAHLLWIRKFKPEVYERISKMLMVSDWLAYRLCGQYCSEPTNASSSMLFDVTKKEWSLEIARLLEVPPEILPPLFTPGQVVGGLTRQAAGFLGLPEQTPVVVGLADSQAACVGCGALNDGDTVAIAGTTMPLQMTLREPLLDARRRAWTGAHALPQLWSLECNAGPAGIAYEWLWQAFGEDGVAEERYELLSAEAAREPPGAAMAFMGPWIADHSRLTFPSLVGFLAPYPATLTPPLTRSKMARAVLENIAFAMRANVSQLEQISGRKVRSLRLCGGLARSGLFGQMVADVCQMPVYVPTIKETSALGAAMCAAVGAGIYDDLAAAADGMADWSIVVRPDDSTRSRYRTLYKRWLKTYRKLLGR